MTRVRPVAPHHVALGLAVLAHVALRLAMVPGRRGPFNVADETGYLINARVLVGGVPGALQEAAFYRGGYSVLLVPAMWLGRTPTSEYQLVLATNAVLSVLVVPLMYLLLHRLFAVPAPRAVLCAAVGAAYPPLVVTTQMAWTESLLPPLVLALAYALAAMAGPGRHTGWWAFGVGALAGFGWTTHGRFAPLLAVVLALVLLVGRERPVVLVPALTGLLLTIAAGSSLNGHLHSASWPGQPGDGDVARVLDNAREVETLMSVVALGAGQWWYLVVATFGLASLGVVALASCVRLGLRDRVTSPPTVAAAFVLASVVGLAVLVGVFLRPASRPDHVVYGRYVEIFAPVLLSLGVARLLEGPARRSAAQVSTGFAVAVAAMVIFVPYADGLVGRSPVNWTTVLALPPLAQTPEQISPVSALLASGLGAALVLLIRRWRARLAVLSLVLALVLSAVAVRVVLVSARDDAAYEVAGTSLRDVEGLSDASTVAYDRAATTALGLYTYQWQLDEASFVLFDSRLEQPSGTRWVITASSWPEGAALGARRVWLHPALDQAVWLLP